MKALQWKRATVVLIAVAALLPYVKNAIDATERRMEVSKRRLVFSTDLSQNYDYYVASQNELKAKGMTLWGSSEVGDFLAELEKISTKTQIPILNTKPYKAGEMANPDSIGAELEIAGTMTGIVKFMHEALNLPGLIAVEGLNLVEDNTEEGGLSAQLVVSRAIYNQKGNNLAL